MDRAFREFQIRIFRNDGALSAQLIMPCWSVDEATKQAEPLLSHDLPKAEIWSDGLLVDTVTLWPSRASSRNPV